MTPAKVENTVMATTGRNDPCPCGSGSKYKNCCGARKAPSFPLVGLRPGLRMKGGVRANPAGDGFIAIVHTWDNIEARGEPTEWRSAEVFATEEAALQYYKTAIRPGLEQLIAKMAKETPRTTAIRRTLG